MTRSRSFSFGMLTSVVLSGVLIASASAQTPPNAALQARARMQQSHQRSGAIGGGYRPYSAITYQNSARMQAQVLNSYGTTLQQLPPATAREHLAELQRNVTALNAEVKKLGAQAAQDADVKAHYESMLEHLAKAEAMCTMIGQTIGNDSVQAVQMCAHCMGVDKELDAVAKDHQEMLKKLGIALPAAAPASNEHDHAPAQP